MSAPSLLDRLGRQITATAVVVRLVAEHGLDADAVSVSNYVHVSVDDPAEFARWAAAIDQTTFTAWLRASNRKGSVALHANGVVSGVEVTVVGTVAVLPGATTGHQEFPLSALGSAEWQAGGAA